MKGWIIMAQYFAPAQDVFSRHGTSLPFQDSVESANALFRKGYSWDDIRAALARYGQDDKYDYNA